MIRNKVIATLHLPSDCSQEDGETSIEWCPINFSIYSALFPDLITDAIDEYLDNHELKHDVLYEIVFAHVVDRDVAGAVLGESFEVIHEETQPL